MSVDHYRFVDPWWLLLPDGGGAVIGVVGSGGRTTVLRRLAAHYRERGSSVLWTQTTAQPAPADLRHHACAETERIAAALGGERLAFVAGEAQGRLYAGLEAAQIEALRVELRPDIVLVDAHERCERPLRSTAPEARWPQPVHLGLIVAPLWAVGRVEGPDTVAGADAVATDLEGRPLRIGSSTLRAALLDADGSLRHAPPAPAVPLPFLTGFGSYRDMDGMFELVGELWRAPGVRAVCLAELLGDDRRDAADLRDFEGSGIEATPLSGERIYAVYPSHLDEL